MNRTKFPCCTRCKMNYYVGEINGPKIPLLLKCGHDMCRNCVKFLSKRSPVITCCICEQAHNYNLGNLPVHYYKIGQVFWLSSNKQMAIHRSISNLKMTNYCPSKSLDSNYKLCKSCHKSANCFCRQCDEAFCNLCFDEIHMESMATSQHIPETLNKINIQLPPEPRCEQHMKNIEFVCITCQLEVCSVCALDSHRPHDIIQLETYNSSKVENLNDYMSKGELLLRKLINCRDNFNVEVQAFQNSRTKKKYTSVDEIKHTVSTYMSVVIGALQNKEQSLLDLLDKSEHADINSMNKILNQLNGLIDELQKNLMLFDQSIKQKNLSSFVLKNAIFDIKNMLDTSYSIAKKNKVQPSIQMEDSLFDSIQNCFTINFDTSDTYIFGYSTEFPPDYKIKTTICISDDELSKRPVSVSSVSTVSDSVTSGSSDVIARDPLPTTVTHDSIAIKMISKNVVEPVIVTAVNAPSDFYLQLLANNDILSMIKEELAKYAITKHRNVENIEKNCVVYSVLTSHKNWCRCNVMNSYEEDGQMLYTVHSIDYGFTETVKHDKIRNVPFKVKSIPPLAIHCALYDLKPNVQLGWCNEAYKLFCELMFNKSGTFYVYPMETLGEVIEVDVVWRDMYPLSIRDALFFLGYGSFNFYVNEALHDKLVNLITLPNVVLMEKNESLPITITHFVSPSEFYLRVADSSTALLDNVMQRLQDIYKPTEDAMHKSYLLYTPQIGMAVAAKFSIDNTWYRAKIIEIPESRMVTVFYVDFGNSETLPWDQLRVLDSSLIKISPQALKAKLAGLIPAHNGLECSEWSLKANAAVMEMTTINCYVAEFLEVLVNDVDDNGVHSVTLFNRTTRGEYSINRKLVSMGHALPMKSSSYVYNNNAVTNRRKPLPDASLLRSYSFDSEDSLKFDGNQAQPPTDKEYKHDTSNQNKSDAPGVEMSIVRVISPKEIILKTINYNPAKLTERMNKEYTKKNSKKLQKDHWKENDKCAVFINRFGNWYRGQVTKIDHVTKIVSVYFYDLDETIEYKSTKNLYVLEDNICKEKCGIIHCSMYKLLPLGTSNGEWPMYTCDRLSGELNKYSSVYINKKGREGDIVWVEIWVKDLNKPKALEPLRTCWININKFMLKEGLAMLDKKNNEVSVVKKKAKKLKRKKQITD
ncbi:RING finger protein 17 isoform X2 [Adelges cooleyi]|uniref:RING finger protein 17 isoform X2 n=1 Tax=Adelges cooleyi TaxID=133065 RepID=UPI0021804FCD|nr:RING finger protein 17 isoform X2 [Adelges cooleyi]